MFLLKRLQNESVYKSSDKLLNVRLVFFGVAWIHLVIAAIVLLPIDMSKDEDPKIRAYSRLKWYFITCWFNLASLAYLPICLYCDWKEKHEQANRRHVIILRKIRDIMFTSILFPTIMYADILFWRIYFKDLSLITPLTLFKYMPGWAQHSLHTVSMVVVIADLCFVPRRRPKTLKARWIIMTLFFVIYGLAIYERYINGDVVYRVLEVFTPYQNCLLMLMSYIDYLFYFSLEWLIIDLIWGKRKTE